MLNKLKKLPERTKKLPLKTRNKLLNKENKSEKLMLKDQMPGLITIEKILTMLPKPLETKKKNGTLKELSKENDENN